MDTIDLFAYLGGLNHAGDFGFRLSFDGNFVDAGELVARFHTALFGRGRVIEHLDDVEAGTERRAASDRDADQVARIFLDRRRPRRHSHAAEQKVTLNRSADEMDDLQAIFIVEKVVPVLHHGQRSARLFTRRETSTFAENETNTILPNKCSKSRARDIESYP